MKKRSFTLIELLTVIVIISILTGLIMAALSGGREQARRTEARLGAEALRSAIGQYEGDFGTLPSDATQDIGGGDEDNPCSDYDDMIAELDGGNPRGIRYIPTDNDQYLDPWDRQYKVRLDHDYSGSIINPADASKTLSYSAAVWSRGPDHKSPDEPIYPWQ